MALSHLENGGAKTASCRRDFAEMISSAEVETKALALSPLLTLSSSRRMTLLACGFLAASESSAALR